MISPSHTRRAALLALLLTLALLTPASLFAQDGFQKGAAARKVLTPAAPQVVFSNPAAITINDAAAATPYPSNIAVSGLVGNITNVTLTLTGLSHVFVEDVDMMVVSPNGVPFVFFSDVGGSAPGSASNLNITLADSAASQLPINASLSSGTFRPTADTPSGDAFAGPAPAHALTDEAAPSSTATFANHFNGLTPAQANGNWALYVVDDSGGDAGSISGGWSLNITQAAPPTTAGQLIISEFRLRGPAGAQDEFIELYNPTSSTVVAQAADASAGLGVTASDGTARCTVPNGTSIPARGHFLCANNTGGTGYSLGSYPSGNNGAAATTATPDATYTADIADTRGIALFDSATSFTLANRLDAVGPASEANTTYKEGTGLAALPTVGAEYAVYRIHDLATGLPMDTGNNATDFRFIATDANATVTNASLGGPGPENLTSPIFRNATIKASLVAPCVASSAAPNRIRTGSGNSGSLSVRRRFTNNTGASVTRLRFRIIDITTSPAPNGSTAILAATTSTTTTEGQPCPNGTVTIQGLTLETPPTQSLGGGYNSSLSAGTVTLGTPIAAGASINVNFLLNISQAGTFRFFVNVEALP